MQDRAENQWSEMLPKGIRTMNGEGTGRSRSNSALGRCALVRTVGTAQVQYCTLLYMCVVTLAFIGNELLHFLPELTYALVCSFLTEFWAKFQRDRLCLRSEEFRVHGGTLHLKNLWCVCLAHTLPILASSTPCITPTDGVFASASDRRFDICACMGRSDISDKHSRTRMRVLSRGVMTS